MELKPKGQFNCDRIAIKREKKVRGVLLKKNKVRCYKC